MRDNLPVGLQLPEHPQLCLAKAIHRLGHLPELDDIHRGLKFRHPVIRTVEQLATVTRRGKPVRPPESPALGKLIDALPQTLVVRQHKPALSAAHDLVNGNTEAAQIAERAHIAPVELPAARLRAVFNHPEIVLSGNPHHRVHIAHAAHHLSGGNRDRPRRNQRLDLARIYRQRVVHIAENRNTFCVHNLRCGRVKPNGRADHLRARAHTGGHKGGMQRRRARTHGQRVLDPENLARQALKRNPAVLLKTVCLQPGAAPQILILHGRLDFFQGRLGEPKPPGNGHKLLRADLGLPFPFRFGHRL